MAHQIPPLKKLAGSRVGALFMEMGTGKTRVAIEFARLRQSRINRVIWFCPVSLKETVRQEIIKHTDSESICIFDDYTTIRTVPKVFWYIVGIDMQRQRSIWPYLLQAARKVLMSPINDVIVEDGNMRNQILQGDVIDVIKRIPVESINCIVTSPPYYGLRNYDLPPTDWAEVSYAPMSGLPPLIIPPMARCLGLEDSIEAYVAHMVLVFRGLWKVLREDGVAWLNLGDSYANSPKGSIVTDNST
jgi:hypothetical protein